MYYEFSDIAALKQAVDTLMDSKLGAPLDGQLTLIDAAEIARQRRRSKQRYHDGK